MMLSSPNRNPDVYRNVSHLWPSQLGRRFDTMDTSGLGDWFVVAPSGDLQIRDNYGLIATAPRIE